MMQSTMMTMMMTMMMMMMIMMMMTSTGNLLVDICEILLRALVSAHELQSAAKHLNARADVEIVDLIRLGVVLVLSFVDNAAIEKLAPN